MPRSRAALLDNPVASTRIVAADAAVTKTAENSVQANNNFMFEVNHKVVTEVTNLMVQTFAQLIYL